MREVLVQEITAAPNEFCTQAEKFNAEEADSWHNHMEFFSLMADMRLKVWLSVAMLKKKLVSLINPRNLPTELWVLVSGKRI